MFSGCHLENMPLVISNNAMLILVSTTFCLDSLVAYHQWPSLHHSQYHPIFSHVTQVTLLLLKGSSGTQWDGLLITALLFIYFLLYFLPSLMLWVQSLGWHGGRRVPILEYSPPTSLLHHGMHAIVKCTHKAKSSSVKIKVLMAPHATRREHQSFRICPSDLFCSHFQVSLSSVMPLGVHSGPTVFSSSSIQA